MYHTMLVRVEAYLKEALHSHTLILATIWHPSLRLDYLDYAFGAGLSVTSLGKKLIDSAYEEKKSEIEINAPYTSALVSNVKTSGHSLGASDEDFLSHKEQHWKKTTNNLWSYLEMAEEPGPEVGENPHLSLAWWSVSR